MERTLDELINRDDPGWPVVQSWMTGAKNPVEVLPVDRRRGEEVLLGLQVTSRSPMGAITLETGGLLVDDGWLRILGAGSPRLSGNLASWNGLASPEDRLPIDPLPGCLIVAHDAVGGFFAINGGAFEGPVKNVYYFATDSLEWMDCGMGYSQFVAWTFHADLDQFYQTERWPGWREDIRAVTGDYGIHQWPPRFTVEGKGPNVSRRSVPMTELWQLYVYKA